MGVNIVGADKVVVYIAIAINYRRFDICSRTLPQSPVSASLAPRSDTKHSGFDT